MPETKRLEINVDGMIPAISRQEIVQATQELGLLLERHCGGSVSTHFLDAQNREIEMW
jgi:enoyl reductase-like protein